MFIRRSAPIGEHASRNAPADWMLSPHRNRVNVVNHSEAGGRARLSEQRPRSFIEGRLALVTLTLIGVLSSVRHCLSLAC